MKPKNSTINPMNVQPKRMSKMPAMKQIVPRSLLIVNGIERSKKMNYKPRLKQVAFCFCESHDEEHAHYKTKLYPMREEFNSRLTYIPQNQQGPLEEKNHSQASKKGTEEGQEGANFYRVNWSRKIIMNVLVLSDKLNIRPDWSEHSETKLLTTHKNCTCASRAVNFVNRIFPVASINNDVWNLLVIVENLRVEFEEYCVVSVFIRVFVH
jgi:hypothetical protein